MLRTLTGLLCLLLTASASRADLGAVAQGNTRFATELYGKLRARDGNLFFSPFSISSALAMTSAGARGRTLEQMQDVLHLIPQKDLHPSLAEITEQLNEGGGPRRGYQLQVANSLWGQAGYAFRNEFVELLGEHYDAGFQRVNFRAAAPAARTINDWVEKKTGGRIKDLVTPSQFTDNTRLVLTSAIYFKGGWQSTFEPAATKAEDFHLSTTKKVKTPLMYQGGSFPYFRGAGFQALELPYTGKDVSMVVLLPDRVDGLEALEKQLTAANLRAWLRGLSERKVEVRLPKFRMDTQYDLKQTLIEMGMSDAFGAADFSGVDGTSGLYISDVVHKAFVEVNERGTEAAGATGVIEALKSTPVVIADFRADRPFLFLIRDRKTQSVLFLGRLVNPA